MTQDQDIDGYFTTARVSAREEAVELPQDSYLSYVRNPNDSEIACCRGMTYEEFTQDRYQAPFLQDLLAFWESLYREPFVGVTADGRVREGVYPLVDAPPADPAPVRAASQVLALLSDDERERYRHPIDAPEWRAWSNPEFVVHRVGLRLEDLASAKADAILELVRASLSPEGYERLREAMSLNGYLGDLVGLPNIMNDRSYWASLFGTPRAASRGAGSCSATTWPSTSCRSAAGTSSRRCSSARSPRCRTAPTRRCSTPASRSRSTWRRH